MKPFVIAMLILVSSQFVFSQRFPFRPLTQPLRVCRPEQPFPFNDTIVPFACLREFTSASNFRDPDATKSIIQISEENGYTIQSHNVTTSDGYILTMFRIPVGRISPARNGKPAVLLLHGWGNSCESWITLPNNKNLAYMLVDAGYDVWLGCHRGCRFSLGHRTLNYNTDLSFWDFSFHEMGIYDLPAMVDHAIMQSGNEKIFVIAHSQGGSAFLAAASEIPNISEKIHAAYLMAPAAYMGSATDPIILTLLPIVGTPLQNNLYRLFRGRFQVQNTLALTRALGLGNICQPLALRCGICDVYTLAPFYFNPAQMNYTNLPRMVAKFYDTFNIRSAVHFGQNTRSCTFRQYDYGLRVNFRKYGAADPPRYNLSRIQTPVYILWAEQDALVSPTDIRRLVNEIPSDILREVARVNDDTFQHVDFLVARDADVLVYRPLIDKMNLFLDAITGAK